MRLSARLPIVGSEDVPRTRSASGIVRLCEVGDQCETVMAMTVREQAAFDSEAVAQLPVGAAFEVTEVGSAGTRVKISAGDVRGWITAQTDTDQPLIKVHGKRKKSWVTSAKDVIDPGDVGETLISMMVREGQNFDSSAIGQIDAGTPFEVLEVVSTRNRVKVAAADLVGWISVKTDLDQPLVKMKPKRRVSIMSDDGDGIRRTSSTRSNHSVASVHSDGSLQKKASFKQGEPAESAPLVAETAKSKAKEPGCAAFLRRMCCRT